MSPPKQVYKNLQKNKNDLPAQLEPRRRPHDVFSHDVRESIYVYSSSRNWVGGVWRGCTKRLIIPEVSSTEPGTPVIEILELCWSNVWKLKIIFSILLWAFTDIVSFALKPLIFFALSF